MAVCLVGMNRAETAALTETMLDLPEIDATSPTADDDMNEMLAMLHGDLTLWVTGGTLQAVALTDKPVWPDARLAIDGGEEVV